MTRPVPCSLCAKPTLTKFSAVICASCLQAMRETRCAGCGRFVGGDSGEIASDEHSLLWHPPCFRTLHPDVSLLSEESVVTRLPSPTASSPTRPPILASPDAPPSRRRRSLWLTGVSAANMTAAVGGEPPRTAERPQDVVAPIAARPALVPTDSRHLSSAVGKRSSGPRFRSDSFESLAARLKVMGLPRERPHKGALLPDTILPADLLQFLVRSKQVSSRAEALVLSSQLLHRGFLVPCDDSVSASSFNDDGTLYVLGMGTPGLIHPSPEPSVYKGDTGPRHSEGAVSSTSAEDGEPNVRTFASAVLQESYFHEPRGRAGSHTGPASPLPSPPAPLLSPRLPSSLPTVQELPPARVGVGSQIGVEEGVNDRMGYLVKQGHRIKNWKRRWFVLSGRFLTYYRKAGEADPAGSIDLTDFNLDKGSDPIHPYRMRLISKRSEGHEYLVEAEGAKDFVDWAKAIDGAMKDFEKR